MIDTFAKKCQDSIEQDPDDARGDRDRKKCAEEHAKLDGALANFLEG